MDLNLQVSPIDLFSAISEHCENAFLLESCEGSEKLARFSFLGFSPKKHIVFKNNFVKINEEERDTKNPLAELEGEIDYFNAEKEGFLSGAVGYFSFDFVKQIEKFNFDVKNEVDFPVFEFGVFDDAIVFDHINNSVKYLHFGKSRVQELFSFIKDASFDEKNFEMYNKKCNFNKDDFCKNVDIAKEHIASGDILQTVLSRRFEVRFSGSLLPFYRKLKAINPSPYMYFLKFGERRVIGSSPENLFRVEGRNVSSYATLAGTRERGATLKEDKKLETELLNDVKESAEHLMLVDLTRNDVGKISEPGSVQVPEFRHVHKYSNVQHIASLVTGKLLENKTAFDAFKAIFPAGTVSGAPKIRAIEILSELEKTNRGPYAGAVGYFSSNRNADFAIGIRTLFANEKSAYIQAGAGIVYDSVPEKEFIETENKAKALLNAIGEDKYEAVINGQF